MERLNIQPSELARMPLEKVNRLLMYLSVREEIEAQTAREARTQSMAGVVRRVR